MIKLDHHWNVFGSLQIVRPRNESDKSSPGMFPRPGFKFTCVDATPKHVTGCFQLRYEAKQLLVVDNVSCTIAFRPAVADGALAEVFRGLSHAPLLLHGNGRFTKPLLMGARELRSKCLKRILAG
jgi:hypothetical protein